MTKSGKIRRKGLAIMLSLGMVASLFVGEGSISRADETYAVGTITINTDLTLKIKGKLNDGKVSDAYIYDITTSASAQQFTIPDNTTISLSSISGFGSNTLVSIGNVAGDRDSFFPDLNVGTGVTIDASGTSLTKVNNYVGAGRTGMTLMLPKTLKTLGAYVLKSTTNAGNDIYVDALNADYADKSTYTGVAFHGYKNSSMKTKFGADGFTADPDKPAGDDVPKYATGSVHFTLSLGEADAHTYATGNGCIGDLFAYANTTDNNYTSFMDLDPEHLPSRPYHNFLGFYDDTPDTPVQVFDNLGDYKGWYQPATAIDEKTLTAHFQAETVNVSFHPNGATSDPDNMEHLVITPTYGETYTAGLPTCNMKRTGYTYIGWKKQDGTKIAAGSTTTKFYENTTLYADWEENSYTIEYNNNGGTGAIADQTVSYENRNSASATLSAGLGFTKNGYDLVGWSLEQNPTATDTIYYINDPNVSHKIDEILNAEPVVVDNSDPANPVTDRYAPRTGKITLYGVWRQGKYMINYNDERYNPAVVSEERVCGDYGSPTNRKLIVRDNITGYTFDGWSDTYGGSATYKKNVALTGDLAAKDQTKELYAVYIPHVYNINYIKSVGDSGDSMDPTVCTYDGNTEIMDCSYTREGHKFLGWKIISSSTSPAAEILPPSATETLINSKVDIQGPFPKRIGNRLYSSSGNAYVTPVWQTESYTIKFQGEGASGIQNKTVTYGGSVTLPELSMENHTFRGWMESDTLYPAKTKTKIENISRNMTLTAAWDDDHFVTINPDSMIKSITARVNGVQKTLVTNGTLAALTFKGGEEFKSITITAADNQLIKSFNITNDSGESLASANYTTPASTITVGGTINFPTASNLNISITVKPQEYKITFNTDGGTIIGTTPTYYTYGTETTLPTYVVKDGSKFYGWKNSSGTIVTMISKNTTGDQTFTAVWSDPNVTGLPQGATISATANGKFVIIKYKDGKTEDVNISAQAITLKNGSNTIQFKAADGKSYMVTVNYTTATELPSTIKATAATGATSAIITYTDGTTQEVAINKYNSETTLLGTRIYFDGLDGKRYMVIPSAGNAASPSPSPTPSSESSGNNQKPQPDEYYMISDVSYNVRNGKASATNPIDWSAKTVKVKDKVKIYGKNYKVTKVTKEAFYGMPKLKKLIIGKNVTSIGANAARDCEKLRTIKIMSGNITSMGRNWLKNIGNNPTVYIKASKKKYKKLKKLIKAKSGCPKNTRFRRIK